LQKKLEDRNPEHVHMIWLETNQHVIELMTDPFGNYLCQKLLEYCNDEERTVLIENASHDLVRIALNQHGTRALQKMIEFISTPGQVQTIINALRYRVVELIQDLNGNHVIQKCLNKLSPMDAQFIFDAVGKHCVDVGTHRHGCCVLQRCIDHASGDQKAWLIRQISDNAYVLVQDPFGNYVVQYILDLNESVFTEPLVQMFQGRVGQLSKQKFSSNVIEKCLRCAQEPSKDMLIEEMLQPSELDRLLRDSFANYVIQTALDYANPAMKTRLIEAIRPYLPAIRTTPYGRRIQAKIQGNEGRSGPSSGQATPNEAEVNQTLAVPVLVFLTDNINFNTNLPRLLVLILISTAVGMVGELETILLIRIEPNSMAKTEMLHSISFEYVSPSYLEERRLLLTKCQDQHVSSTVGLSAVDFAMEFFCNNLEGVWVGGRGA